jgi:hypothetical protein
MGVYDTMEGAVKARDDDIKRHRNRREKYDYEIKEITLNTTYELE